MAPARLPLSTLCSGVSLWLWLWLRDFLSIWLLVLWGAQSDHGTPKGNMTAVGGGKFKRVYSKATITLDCADFSATFDEHAEQ